MNNETPAPPEKTTPPLALCQRCGQWGFPSIYGPYCTNCSNIERGFYGPRCEDDE